MEIESHRDMENKTSFKMQMALIILATMFVSSLVTLFFLKNTSLTHLDKDGQKLHSLVTLIRKTLQNNQACTQTFQDKIMKNKSKKFESIKTSQGIAEMSIGAKITNLYHLKTIELRHIDSISKTQGIFMLKIVTSSKLKNKVFRNIVYGSFNSKKRIKNCIIGQSISI